MARRKKRGSLISDIKNQIKKSGANKGKFIYFKSGNKVRVRFLNDMEDGFKVLFHDSFKRGINVPCQEFFGRDCPYCDDDDLRHRDLYAWTVYDYDAKEVKILMGAGNSFSPVPALVGMFEAYGTLIDRDYIITKQGSQTNTSFSVAPMDKVRFKNKKAKPISEEKFLKLLDKAFPADEEVEDDDDEEETEERSSNRRGGGRNKARNKRSTERDHSDDEYEDEPDDDESDYEDYEEDEDAEEAEIPYEDMTAKELYRLCKARKISCKPRKKADYYIELLEEADYEEEEEEDEDDAW